MVAEGIAEHLACAQARQSSEMPSLVSPCRCLFLFYRPPAESDDPMARPSRQLQQQLGCIIQSIQLHLAAVRHTALVLSLRQNCSWRSEARVRKRQHEAREQLSKTALPQDQGGVVVSSFYTLPFCCLSRCHDTLTAAQGHEAEAAADMDHPRAV